MASATIPHMVIKETIYLVHQLILVTVLMIMKEPLALVMVVVAAEEASPMALPKQVLPTGICTSLIYTVALVVKVEVVLEEVTVVECCG